MNRLQICLYGPDFSSFWPHSYGYEPANELKTGLKPPNFRFGPLSPTASERRAKRQIIGVLKLGDLKQIEELQEAVRESGKFLLEQGGYQRHGQAHDE